MHAPIAVLQAKDRPGIEAHLLRLSAEDRSLRFAAGLVTDTMIRRHVDQLHFERDHVLGLVSLRGQVFGLAHGAVFVHAGRQHVELAFSVDAEWRRHGLGHRLMAALLARVGAACGDVVVLGRCGARNLPMRRVFEAGQLLLRRDLDEIEARRELHRQALLPAGQPGAVSSSRAKRGCSRPSTSTCSKNIAQGRSHQPRSSYSGR